MERVKNYFAFSQLTGVEKFGRIGMIVYLVFLLMGMVSGGVLTTVKLFFTSLPLFFIFLLLMGDQNFLNKGANDQLEKQLQQQAKLKRIFIVVGVILLLGLIIVNFTFKPRIVGVFGYMLLSLVLVFLTFVYLWSPLKDSVTKGYGEKIITPLLQKNFSKATFTPKAEIEESLLVKSQLFPDFDTYGGENLIIGEVAGRPFRYAKVQLFEEISQIKADDQVDSYLSEIFNGSFLIMDNNTTIPEVIRVRDKNYLEKVMKKKYRELDQVLLDNPDFDGQFIVKSKDPETVQTVLSPRVQKNLLEIASKRDYPLDFAFLDNQLFVRLNRPDQLSAKAKSSEAKETPEHYLADLKKLIQELQNIFV